MKKRPQRKKRRTVPVPIASMGDIAFLLIIFFMVCSEVSKEKNLAVVLPLSEHVKKTEAVVVARIAIDENGEIYFDGARVDNAKDVEWGIRAMLTNTISDDQRHVQFKCDSAITQEIYQPVIQAIVSAGGILEAVGELE